MPPSYCPIGSAHSPLAGQLRPDNWAPRPPSKVGRPAWMRGACAGRDPLSGAASTPIRRGVRGASAPIRRGVTRGRPSHHLPHAGPPALRGGVTPYTARRRPAPALPPSPTGRPSVKIRRLVQATGPPAAPAKGRPPINWLPAVVARPRAGAREQGRPPLQAPGAAGSLDGEV